MRDLRDEVVLAALEGARGDDRDVLVGALADARGGEGPAALRRFLQQGSGERGSVRAVAVYALARRMREADTLTYVGALADRYAPVQVIAALALAEYGDDRAGEEPIEWLGRKLKRKNRSSSWDPLEVPSVLAYAARHGLLDAVASVLDRNSSSLEPEERTRLTEVWPDLEVWRQEHHQVVAPPDSVVLDAWLYEHTQRDDEKDPVADEYIARALARAQKRARRPKGPS